MMRRKLKTIEPMAKYGPKNSHWCNKLNLTRKKEKKKLSLMSTDLGLNSQGRNQKPWILGDKPDPISLFSFSLYPEWFLPAWEGVKVLTEMIGKHPNK